MPTMPPIFKLDPELSGHCDPVHGSPVGLTVLPDPVRPMPGGDEPGDGGGVAGILTCFYAGRKCCVCVCMCVCV